MCLFGKWDHAPPPNRSLLGEDQELERPKSSLHHFIILPIFYFPSQDWWCGREGGCHFFLLVKRGGGGRGYCQKIMYDVGGGGSSKILPLKKYPLPPRKRLSKSHVYKQNQFSFRDQKDTCYLQSLSPLNFSINHFLNLTWLIFTFSFSRRNKLRVLFLNH